ncbi:hypothetical protein CROQUDRAFT_132580 [Cronartium quercuum f. sp. fusiforme G11]|uniref:Uncharacterized protein n=1 Tax=Cronartium quercuum f. sp. fusiforme G11 TaxID=708437 RepID=A0A9P6TCE9_9BASI|nr:hypothetical protein CROQUDRAFT_132580 [Cronartium quercuum f. sp. fusiforme G11]
MPSENARHHAFLTLKRFVELQNTRGSLLEEFQSAIESGLYPSSTSVSPPERALNGQGGDNTQAPNTQHNQPVSACRSAHAQTAENTEEYLQQVIAICTSGFREIKTEAALLVQLLREDLKQPSLAALIEKVEELEGHKMNRVNVQRPTRNLTLTLALTSFPTLTTSCISACESLVFTTGLASKAIDNRTTRLRKRNSTS